MTVSECKQTENHAFILARDYNLADQSGMKCHHHINKDDSGFSMLLASSPNSTCIMVKYDPTTINNRLADVL